MPQGKCKHFSYLYLHILLLNFDIELDYLCVFFIC